MNATSRLTLLLGVALAAAAVAAAPAGAQETAVEVNEEDAATAPCAPCQIHFVGESHFRNLLTGSLITQCEDELAGIINHDGTGEVMWSGSQHTATACFTNCSSQEAHWPLSNPGERGDGSEHAVMRLCFSGGGFGDNHCNVELQYSDALTPHEGTLSTTHLCSGGATRYEGSWALEHAEAGNDEIQIEHLEL